MNPIPCNTVRKFFSAYLDGDVSGREMQAVAAHLQSCAGCHTEFAAWRGVQHALTSLGSVKAPPELGLKLRIAISHESARRQGHWYDSVDIWWKNLVRPALLQVSAGLAGATLLIGSMVMLLGVAAPKPVLANDEPLGALSSPHLLYSAAFQEPFVSGVDATIVVRAKINSSGEVYDYTILSGPDDVGTNTQLRNQLLMEVYEPARVFGMPVSGQVLITFSGVSVRA